MRKMALLAAGFPLLFMANIARSEPVVIGEGVAGPIAGQGTGLCESSAISMNPNVDFVLADPNNFLGHVNAFMDAHAADRVEATRRTIFDLSNNNSAGLMQSYGDFRDVALPTCKTGGCDFLVNVDPNTSFASRFRGYFNVIPDVVNKPIHFGFYTDDAVGLVIYDKQMAPHTVVVRAPEIGLPIWRVTNEVRFMTAGLYPIEVIYLEIGEHAALEMSYFVGTFTDFERPANQTPIVRLDDAGFEPFKPIAFFQTLTGNPPFPDVNACRQCDRAMVNKSGDNGCMAGQYCNDAAVCAPCDTDRFCGPTCSPCGGDAPLCLNIDGNVQCSPCRTDADCSSGGACNPVTKTCNDGSAGGAGGAGGNGGNGGNPDIPSDGGCVCHAVSRSSHTGTQAMIGLALAGIGMARRRQRRIRTR